jgi:hypothetical protein
MRILWLGAQLDRRHANGTQTFRRLDKVERHGLPCLQAAESRHADVALVDECVPLTVIPCDKTKTFCFAKPLANSCFHDFVIALLL